MLGIPKVFREAARISAGDHIVVTIERDVVKRVVTPPVDFAKKLFRNPKIKAAWEKLSYTHKKEHVRAI